MKQSSFQFANPILTKLQFQLNSNFQPPESGEVEMETELNTKIPKELSSGSAVVTLRISIAKKAGANSPFSLEAEMKSHFLWNPEELDAKQAEKLLSQNAPALLLGYLRPIIAETTQKANLPPYHLPFMDFTKD